MPKTRKKKSEEKKNEYYDQWKVNEILRWMNRNRWILLIFLVSSNFTIPIHVKKIRFHCFYFDSFFTKNPQKYIYWFNLIIEAICLNRNRNLKQQFNVNKRAENCCYSNDSHWWRKHTKNTRISESIFSPFWKLYSKNVPI